LKKHVTVRHARLWWGYPLYCPSPNKHTYFTILQIVESAFRMSMSSFFQFAVCIFFSSVLYAFAFEMLFVCVFVIVWLWLATIGPYGCSATPAPAGLRRRIERKRQKRMGRDKGSSNRTAKGTVTTIPIRRVHKTNSRMHRATLTTHCRARS